MMNAGMAYYFGYGDDQATIETDVVKVMKNVRRFLQMIRWRMLQRDSDERKRCMRYHAGNVL